MLAFDLDDEKFDEITAAYDATPKQVKLAQNRALRRTAATLRKLSSKGLQSELGLRNAKALRRRLKEYRVGKGGSGLKLWYGANDLPISSFKGRPRAVSGGVQVGDTTIHGGFFSKMQGKRRVMVRTDPKGRWSITEATLPVADRMMTFLEENVFVDIDAIFFRHFNHEIRAATVLKIGEHKR